MFITEILLLNKTCSLPYWSLKGTMDIEQAIIVRQAVTNHVTEEAIQLSHYKILFSSSHLKLINKLFQPKSIIFVIRLTLPKSALPNFVFLMVLPTILSDKETQIQDPLHSTETENINLPTFTVICLFFLICISTTSLRLRSSHLICKCNFSLCI
jgi:hypothetical protein